MSRCLMTQSLLLPLIIIVVAFAIVAVNSLIIVVVVVLVKMALITESHHLGTASKSCNGNPLEAANVGR